MTPKVLIVLTTYNGAAFLQEQLDSIARQEDVDWRIEVHDDDSTDATIDILQRFREERESAVSIERHRKRSGSAQASFLRAFRSVDCTDFDYVALADQDDIWQADKLKRSIDALRTRGADGISSDVEAFWPNGRKIYVSKAQPQRAYDHFFQSPGPGCTFVMKARVFEEFSHFLQTGYSSDQALLHDHLIYWFWRENGHRWAILNESTMLYRQHADNAFGANTGLSASVERLYRALFTPYFKDLLVALGTDTSSFRSPGKWRELQRSGFRSFITYLACLLH